MTDLDGFNFVKHRGALWPRDFHSDELMDRIGEGNEIMVRVSKKRNPKHHRLLFALLRKVIDNTDCWASENDLLVDLKFATGLCEKRINAITGIEYFIAGSISFASMDQTRFSQWFDIATHILSEKILGCAQEDLVREIHEMCAGDKR